MKGTPSNPALAGPSTCAWAERLENVLDDGRALERFRAWMGADEDSSRHPLDLHFALLAYRRWATAGDHGTAAKVAAATYNRYLRPNGGLCRFIDAAAGEAVRAGLAAPAMDPQLFAPCEPDLYRFLRHQHALFCSSREFLDLYNESVGAEAVPSTSTDATLSLPTLTVSDTSSSSARAAPSRSSGRPTARLTASTLFQSQRERESTMGQFEREFGPAARPLARYPYVGGQATTSQNDSAVSSAFSSEAASSQYYGILPAAQAPPLPPPPRRLRDEQRRANPHSHVPFPPRHKRAAALLIGPQTAQAHGTAPTGPGPTLSALQFDHASANGRAIFAARLSERLQRAQVELQRQEESLQGAGKCEDPSSSLCPQFGITGKESATAAEDASQPLAGLSDRSDELELDDDVVDAYYRRRVLLAPGIGADTSTANSQQQTPPAVSMALDDDAAAAFDNVAAQSRGRGAQLAPPAPRKPRRRSQRSSSADRMDVDSNGTLGSGGLATGALVTSTSGTIDNSAMATLTMLMSQSCIGPGFNPQLHHHHQFNSFQPQAQPQIFHHQMAQSYCVSYALPPQPQYRQQQQYLQQFQPQQQSQVQQQQMQPYRPQPRKGFAPPPGKTAQQQCNEIYCDNDCDTSGIGSMTYISDVPPPLPLVDGSISGIGAGLPSMQIPKVDRAHVFKKYRQMGGSVGGCEVPQPLPPRSTDEWPGSMVQQPPQQITIMCRSRDAGTGSGVPLVAHVPFSTAKCMTLKDFRRCLSISSREKKRFFFQTACEDGSAPYQLLMINDNATVLPIFGGKISAECCSVSDSE